MAEFHMIEIEERVLSYSPEQLRLREPQLICIAQILAVLQCEVDIIYVRER